MSIKYKHHRLVNGLQILTDYMPQIESVSIRILFKVGSKDEGKAKDGISHLVEHMNFKGTVKRTAKDIAEEFDMIGGYLNAYTSKERTVYYAKVLKEDIETAIEVLSDILINSVYDIEELEKEKKVIEQEILDAQDDPEDVLFEAMWQKAFPTHQIGKPITGTCATIAETSRNDIIDYTQLFYNPHNAIIAISGNFNESELLDIIRDKFGKWENLAVAGNDMYDNAIPRYVGGDVRITREIEQVHIALGFNGISYHHDDYYLYQVAALVAGGSMSSRLFQEVREKLGLAYNISAFCSSYGDCGIWCINASTGPDSVDQLIDTIIKELHVMSHDISEREVMSAKAQIKSSLLMSQETSSNRAEKLVNNYATFGKVISNDEIVAKIEAINHLMVCQCVTDLLQSTHQCIVAAVGNIKQMQSYEEIVAKIKSTN